MPVLREIAIAAVVSALAVSARGDCSTRLPGRPVSPGETICIFTSTYPNDEDVITAADHWNNECGGGDVFPSLNVGGCAGSPVSIAVEYINGISTNPFRTCGEFVPSASRTGALTGGTIRIWRYGQYLSGPETGTLYPCDARFVDLLTHEMGHVLGLDNAPTGPACYGHIMGQYMTEDRTIYPDDCAEVNQLWTTPSEQQATCNRYCWTTCDNGTCPPQPVSTTPHPTMTPILVDLDRNGFHLAGLDAPVMFDLDADGELDRISWTAAQTGDAFLVFDRNGNGSVDDGRELFGNATLLANGAAALNGYEALLELDDEAYGGNGDSVLTPADASWELLQVWTDLDHDAIADAGELASLSAAGIALLDTDYKRSNHQDAHGNLFRFRAAAMVRNPIGHLRPTTSYDVYFVEQP